MDSYDYIVVGGGAAGCVVAARLSEDPANRVALLEAGPPDGSLIFKLPFLVFMAATAKEYNSYIETDPIPGLNGRKLKAQHGRVLGGGSTTNGMQFTRGRSVEFDAWLEAGCTGWGFDDVLPYFRKLETHSRGASHWHGTTGPLKIRPAKSGLPIGELFLESAAKMGFPTVDDLNCDAPVGFGFSDVNIYRGERSSSSSAYIRPARNRKNLTVLTGAEVVRVVVEGGRTTGVEIAHEGNRKTLRCEREVVVSAGACRSPQVLLLSGIGPAEQLREFGIPVVVDSPQVGKNYQNHASFPLKMACNGPVTSYKYLNPVNALKEGIEYVFSRSGALAESALTVSGIFRTDPSIEVADASISMLTALFDLSSKKTPSFWELLPKEEGFTTFVKIMSFSRGEVSLGSADPLAPPRVQPNYFNDPRDMQTIAKALNMIREVMHQDPIRRYIKSEVLPGAGVTDPAELEASIRQNAGHSSHHGGTCAMGGAPTSVVDPQLRVRGVEGLRIADPSIMPAIPNAGTHAGALMIGEKAAAMILGAA